MYSRLSCLTLATIGLLSAGCGTFSNVVWLAPFEGGERVYGGVRVDMDVLQRAASGETGIYQGGKQVQDSVRQTETILACAFDLPLTAIGDTLTLPYVLWLQANRQAVLGPVTRPPNEVPDRGPDSQVADYDDPPVP